MPTHDILDNWKETLVEHINHILSSTESARFAAGCFFLSGLESIGQQLAGVKELRLLIGNTTNRETLGQLAEGYRRLELVHRAAMKVDPQAGSWVLSGHGRSPRSARLPKCALSFGLRFLFGSLPCEDKVRRFLRLGCGLDNQPLVLSEPLKPGLDVGCRVVC
jgi:hypothetical protein